nr:helix-turn-helix domain-containing protein [Pseudomonas benzenivorans]
MRSKGFEGMACSIARVLEAIGDRWGMLVLRDLTLGLRRYEDLRHSTGITNSTLADRLRHLESQGLIQRTLYQERPCRYEYQLTSKGRDLTIVLQALAQVGDKWGLDAHEEPPLLFIDQVTNENVKLTLVSDATNEPVKMSSIRMQAGPGADDLVRWRLDIREKAQRVNNLA